MPERSLEVKVATYNNLIRVFECADYIEYADITRELPVHHIPLNKTPLASSPPPLQEQVFPNKHV